MINKKVRCSINSYKFEVDQYFFFVCTSQHFEQFKYLVLSPSGRIKYIDTMGKGDINKHAQELMHSIMESNFENVKKLIDGKMRKKDKDKFFVNQENDGEMNSDYQTAVLAAAQNDNSRILQYLIEAKASVNFVLKDIIRGKVQKQTPLHAAVDRGLTENVRLLLDANSNVNAVDHYGRTALHISVIKADCSTARMLLHRGSLHINKRYSLRSNFIHL